MPLMHTIDISSASTLLPTPSITGCTCHHRGFEEDADEEDWEMAGGARHKGGPQVSGLRLGVFSCERS